MPRTSRPGGRASNRPDGFGADEIIERFQGNAGGEGGIGIAGRTAARQPGTTGGGGGGAAEATGESMPKRHHERALLSSNLGLIRTACRFSKMTDNIPLSFVLTDALF